MKAFILSAGLGERLLPLSLHRPKPMMPLVNKPILKHNLNWLKLNGINEVMINLHHLPKAILGLKIPSGMKVEYSYESELLGTAGGLKKVESFLKQETFLMMNSDIIIELNLSEVMDFHRQKAALATMVIRGKQAEFGSIELDEQGRIRDILGKTGAKDGTPLIEAMFCGIHIFEPDIFAYIPTKRAYEINQQVYPQLIREGRKVYGYWQRGYWNEIGTPGRYLQVHKDILDKKIEFDLGLKEREDGLWIGKGVKISSTAKLLGPIVIGDKTRIEDEAVIGPYTVTGQGCLIGRGSELEECIIWDNITIEPKQKMKRTILSNVFQFLQV